MKLLHGLFETDEAVYVRLPPASHCSLSQNAKESTSSKHYSVILFTDGYPVLKKTAAIFMLKSSPIKELLQLLR